MDIDFRDLDFPGWTRRLKQGLFQNLSLSARSHQETEARSRLSVRFRSIVPLPPTPLGGGISTRRSGGVGLLKTPT